MDIPITDYPATVAEIDELDDIDDLSTSIALAANRALTIAAVVTAAATELIEMHRSTGLDLTDRCPGLINLVALVHPDVVFEGSGDGTAAHTAPSSTGGETGVITGLR